MTNWIEKKITNILLIEALILTEIKKFEFVQKL
jgi:hypothetical protein